MEQINASYNVLDAVSRVLGNYAGVVNHVPMSAVICGTEFDQQSELIVNGMRVTTHSKFGSAWPVYLQVHELDGTVSRVVGYYTLKGISFLYGDIARSTGIQL